MDCAESSGVSQGSVGGGYGEIDSPSPWAFDVTSQAPQALICSSLCSVSKMLMHTFPNELSCRIAESFIPKLCSKSLQNKSTSN